MEEGKEFEIGLYASFNTLPYLVSRPGLINNPDQTNQSYIQVITT